jgi:hypothetical protein
METDRESYLKEMNDAPSTEKQQPFDIFTFYARISPQNDAAE